MDWYANGAICMYVLQHDNINEMTCALSEVLDQLGRPPSLITVFAMRPVCSLGPKVVSDSNQTGCQADLSLRLALR